MHDINIAIVNWKMKNEIDKCLTTLYEDSAASGLNIIIHIVDNSENIDGIKELLNDKFFEVKYINPGGNIGFAKAQNLGLAAAEAKYYLSLNPDVEFIHGGRVFKKLVKFMEENPSAGIIGPKLLNSDNSIQESCYRFPSFFSQIARRLNLDKKLKFFKKEVDYYLMRDFDHNSTAMVDWLMGSFMLARRELVEKIGFFDDRYFMYFEDCDWCRRAWLSGYKAYYLPDIIVKHLHKRESAAGSPFMAALTNPIARIHLKSWLQYFLKWGVKKIHYGR
ncbi:glycosyltransferase family 2 protein [Candidatus Falkowbacteria bacterium]|nr:glycosyltransferase family 2 protein [Candidatus Falkowbacteria bacterium]